MDIPTYTHRPSAVLPGELFDQRAALADYHRQVAFEKACQQIAGYRVPLDELTEEERQGFFRWLKAQSEPLSLPARGNILASSMRLEARLVGIARVIYRGREYAVRKQAWKRVVPDQNTWYWWCVHGWRYGNWRVQIAIPERGTLWLWPDQYTIVAVRENYLCNGCAGSGFCRITYLPCMKCNPDAAIPWGYFEAPFNPAHWEVVGI